MRIWKVKVNGYHFLQWLLQREKAIIKMKTKNQITVISKTNRLSQGKQLVKTPSGIQMISTSTWKSVCSSCISSKRVRIYMISVAINVLQFSSGGGSSKLNESSPVVIHTQLLVFVSKRTQIYLSVKELSVQIVWLLFSLLHSLCINKVWIQDQIK